jgi:hypothetical protein
MRGAVLRGVLHPTLSAFVLRRVIRDPQQVHYFHALLHNTVSPTVLRAGSKTNVIPSEAEAELDGRILPGQDLDSFLAEVRAVVGDGFEFEPIMVAPPVAADSRTPLFATMAEGLRRHDPEAVAVVPMMVTGGTDAKHLARVGIPCYGFTPIQLPPEMDFMQMIHGHKRHVQHYFTATKPAKSKGGLPYWRFSHTHTVWARILRNHLASKVHPLRTRSDCTLKRSTS